jgi:methylthioribose-1-phosphate isomerase
MKVRGAPAIAIVAMLSLASELLAPDNEVLQQTPEEVHQYISAKLDYLVTSRPTAVNLSDAARKLEKRVSNRAKEVPGPLGREVADTFIQSAVAMLGNDLEDNQRIGHNGAEWIASYAAKPGQAQVAVLTHCNTGYGHLNTSFANPRLTFYWQLSRHVRIRYSIGGGSFAGLEEQATSRLLHRD